MSNAVLIHGGAGSPLSMNGILEDILNKIAYDGDPLNAVVNSVVSMEDNILFNAGTGSVPRLDGSIQMDAAVMSDGNFGSVIC
ncbi:isoaspartyl peptidase/L-asparaginase, partial [Acidiplasma aeolicum]|uniref:isoaspartyl peptidase/L-asparaginase n=1 Tax=Acidiplasma aeolicum TaxID=507754 RepID=UPI000AF8C37B